MAFKSEHLSNLTSEVLRDLARNDSASREVRKAAVELMLDKNFPHVNHPELRELVLQIKAERDAKSEVEALVESAMEEVHVPNGTITVPAEPLPVQPEVETPSQEEEKLIKLVFGGSAANLPDPEEVFRDVEREARELRMGMEERNGRDEANSDPDSAQIEAEQRVEELYPEA